jgi:hypothetical protein
MNIHAKVAVDKQKHPERYCPFPRCLWKTAKLNHETQVHEGGGYCPRHRNIHEPARRGNNNVLQLAIRDRLRAYRSNEVV